MQRSRRIGRVCTALAVLPLLVTGCAAAAPTAHPVQTASLRVSLVMATRTESNRQRTAREVTRLLDAVRLPAGAHRRFRSPVRELRTSDLSLGGGSYAIDRHRWWTSGDSVHDVLAWVRRHAPRGCTFDGSGSSSGPDQPTVYSVQCQAPSDHATFEPQVDVEAVRTATGSAVRADAQAVWFPHRPAYSYVRDPGSVRVVVERHPGFPQMRHAPTVRRTLGSRAARRLARVLDRQTVAPPVTFACPADSPGVDDRLVFDTPRGTVAVEVGLTGCPTIVLRTAHHRTVALAGSGAVDAVVRHALNLGRRYRV